MSFVKALANDSDSLISMPRWDRGAFVSRDLEAVMGKIVLPFSMVLAERQTRLGQFRRSLRRQHQELFDELSFRHSISNAGQVYEFDDRLL